MKINTSAARFMATSNIENLVNPAPNHVMFQAPVVTYCPFSPGGKIAGYVESKQWEPVRQAFAENFAEGLEKGAQLVIRVDGENVVDLYGFSDSCTTTKHEYDGDTLQNIYRCDRFICAYIMIYSSVLIHISFEQITSAPVALANRLRL